MGDVVKDPKFSKDSEIDAQNEKRRLSIAAIQKWPVEKIRELIACSLDTDIGRPATLPKGEILHIHKSYLIREEDKAEHTKLVFAQSMIAAGPSMGGPGGGGIMTEATIKQIFEIQKKIDDIYRRGSDAVRGYVTKAADWACVPPAMLAAILQQENSPSATDFQKLGQSVERGLQALIGKGSTGFGNVKPETLATVKSIFATYYKFSVEGPGVKKTGQNKNIQTDIYHAAAVLRHGLNQAWSVGERSLNKDENKKYTYYPYFGGVVSKDVAIRAMGHYNGMGNDAKAYGTGAMGRITKQQLRFLEAK